MAKNKHVVPHAKGWAVKTAGASKAGSIHSTQAEAIGKAKQSAMANKSEMFVHGRNGRIRERNSYGNDPFPPRG